LASQFGYNPAPQEKPLDLQEVRMSVETPSGFAQVIQEHLELKRRNAELDSELPIERYKGEDPFGNHPLFKSEQQARLEETMDGMEKMDETADVVLAHATWPGEEPLGESSEDLWGRSRDFDWGD
jgi:hypothetical protein